MTLGLFDVAFVGALSRYDADAQDYINRVIAADVAAGNSSGLEAGVQDAYNAFFVACKSDGMINAIKACCIVAGAQTLQGCLVPLVGAAPTNFNFVAGDYNRKTGLVGDKNNKYLNCNRNNNADPQNSQHMCCWVSSPSTISAVYMGAGATTAETGVTNINPFGATINFRSRHNATTSHGSFLAAGFIGVNRSSSSEYVRRVGGVSSVAASTSQAPFNGSIGLFASASGTGKCDARLSFYSIGESLDLALLDARVTALMNALAAAIP
jgi:hypothetical protein